MKKFDYLMVNPYLLFYLPIRFVYERERETERTVLNKLSISDNNKCDLANESFLGDITQLDDYCREKGFLAWFKTSAKENIGINEAARFLVAKVTQLRITCMLSQVDRNVHSCFGFHVIFNTSERGNPIPSLTPSPTSSLMLIIYIFRS